MTEDTRETFQMIDARAGSSHQLTWSNFLLTTTALGTETPAKYTGTRN